MSVGFTVVAATSTTTSPEVGDGHGRSAIFSISGPPNAVTSQTRISPVIGERAYSRAAHVLWPWTGIPRPRARSAARIGKRVDWAPTRAYKRAAGAAFGGS